MTDTDELVGLWDSLPYAYGAMESSTIALLADGTGWSTWQNAVKGFELTLLTWSRESADAFTITEHQLVGGSWEPERHNELIATDPPMTLSTVTRLHYTLVRETPPQVSEPMLGLKLDGPFAFARAYALLRRDISLADRPIVVDA